MLWIELEFSVVIMSTPLNVIKIYLFTWKSICNSTHKFHSHLAKINSTKKAYTHKIVYFTFQWRRCLRGSDKFMQPMNLHNAFMNSSWWRFMCGLLAETIWSGKYFHLSNKRSIAMCFLLWWGRRSSSLKDG